MTSEKSIALEDSPACPDAQRKYVTEDSVPIAAQISINDLLEHGAHIKPGQKVALIAYLDGLYGGDNLVDRQAIQWIRRAIEERGNQVEVLWVDEPSRIHAWKFPDQVRAVMERSDLTINHTLDLTMEEIIPFRQFVNRSVREGKMAPMVRNFATTAPLLCSAWAQTPQELVSEIRLQASLWIKPGLKWKLTDPNGSHLEGVILPSPVPEMKYGTRREEGSWIPWPEWVVPPIAVGETSGIVVFDRMLSWWSRYIGIPPFFAKPVTLTINEARIVKIEGGEEADAIRRFLDAMKERCGESAYYFDQLHWGVHPQARISPQQCPSVLYRRLIEHSHSCNVHVHVGSPQPNAQYPYWAHITGDVRNTTFSISEQMIYKNGHLTALDHPAVLAVAARYPGRPGLTPEPFQG
jgi:hypothetical protein